MKRYHTPQKQILARIPQVKHYYAQGLYPSEICTYMNKQGFNISRHDVNYIIKKLKLVRGTKIKEYK